MHSFEENRNRRGCCLGRDRRCDCRRPRLPAGGSDHPLAQVIAERSSIATSRNAVTRFAASARERLRRNPTTGIAGCCARAASGHVATALPKNVMNSRRFMQAPPRRRMGAIVSRQLKRCQCPLWVIRGHMQCNTACLLYPPKTDHSSAWCEPDHAGLICPDLESGGAAQESCVMLLRAQFNHYCEVVGRASACVAFVTMASVILAATAVDVLLTVWNRAHPF